MFGSERVEYVDTRRVYRRRYRLREFYARGVCRKQSGERPYGLCKERIILRIGIYDAGDRNCQVVSGSAVAQLEFSLLVHGDLGCRRLRLGKILKLASQIFRGPEIVGRAVGGIRGVRNRCRIVGISEKDGGRTVVEGDSHTLPAYSAYRRLQIERLSVAVEEYTHIVGLLACSQPVGRIERICRGFVYDGVARVEVGLQLYEGGGVCRCGEPRRYVDILNRCGGVYLVRVCISDPPLNYVAVVVYEVPFCVELEVSGSGELLGLAAVPANYEEAVTLYRHIGILVRILHRSLRKDVAYVLYGCSEAYLHRVFSAEPALRSGGDFARLAQQVGEVGA